MKINSIFPQGIVKFHSFLSKHKDMKILVDFMVKVYGANKSTSANKNCLQKSVNLTVLIFKVGMVLLITTAILTCIRPCISYVFFGKVELIVPIYFPGIDETEIAGYSSIAALHVYILFIFVIGTAATDLGLMTVTIHSYTMAQLFRNAVNDFNSMVGNGKRNVDTKFIQAALNNLIAMHIDFIK